VPSSRETDSETPHPGEAAAARRPWYRRPRRVIPLAVVGVLLVAGGIAFAVAWSQRGAREASLEQAVEKFRGEHQASSAGFLSPATGVYRYHGNGDEKLSVLGTTQHWGPSLPSTVTRDRGCWTFHLEYSTHHWQDWNFCPQTGALQEVGGQTFQAFDFVATTLTDTNVFTCSPPGDTIRLAATTGQHWTQSCSGHSTSRGTTVTSAGTNTFLGLAMVDVGGTQVPAYHYRVDRGVTGSQTGSERSQFWYSARDGLPLRIERSVRVESPSPIGAVVYTEQGNCVLTSLEPAR
jgi:hypothetical protein